MIVLDTNVVSEAMKPKPHPVVQAWLDQQAAETLYLSSITLAELLFGIGAMPSGRRKNILAQTLDGLLELFGERVLVFDADAARHYAELAVTARAAGKGFPTPDGYIAAIAAARSFTVATRDVAPFQTAGLNVINPWVAQQLITEENDEA
ncbi:type II toxin-antitoxin system VapC family toxin [Candidatus Thiosymbion oneisti]|uniref:type II toxin-antitoxin system VapC family toxin n=1 Tax=Candidatus Thiosymbion oneisti TaxID=589554 RepID=UPI000B3199C0|nr:type II toxin-antitoxin system VapC family toxin [Candidatus Thiosymbion oneisti]